MSSEALWILQLATTMSLVGLIWTIQLVHYPSFSFVETSQFKVFHDFHVQRISVLVAPLMIAEVLFAALIIWQNPGSAATLNFLSVIGLWLLTFFVSVPRHNALATNAFDSNIAGSLTHTNWLRTILWTARGVGILWHILT